MSDRAANWALAISLVVFVPLVSALVMAIAPTSTSGRVLTLVINIPMYLWLVWKIAYRSTWLNGATGSLLVLLALVLISVVFASVYLGLDREHAGSFANERLDVVDSLYYSAAVATTTGFGDLTADTNEARLLSTCQMVVNAGVVLSALGVALSRSG